MLPLSYLLKVGRPHQQIRGGSCHYDNGYKLAVKERLGVGKLSSTLESVGVGDGRHVRFWQIAQHRKVSGTCEPFQAADGCACLRMRTGYE
jgi:hypothetical protein